MRTYTAYFEDSIHEAEGDEYSISDNILKVFFRKEIVLIVNMQKIIAIEIQKKDPFI